MRCVSGQWIGQALVQSGHNCQVNIIHDHRPITFSLEITCDYLLCSNQSVQYSQYCDHG